MKIRKLLPLLVMLLIAGGAVAFILTRGSIGVQELLAWSPENKWLAALAALAAYALKSQTVVVPYALIATAVGLIFDLPAALAVNTLGSVVCISLPYLTGRGSDGVLVDALLARQPRMRAFYEANRRHLFLVSLVLRVANLSNDILGLVFGSLKMKYWEYLLSSLVGILPAMVLYTVLGNDLDPFSAPVLISFGVDVASISAAFLLLRARGGKKADNKTDGGGQ